jgi:uncharacterized damage-inducible protein DinB
MTDFDYSKAIPDAWKTSNRTTVFLIEHIGKDLWNEIIPGSPRRTVGMLASHIHNSRCSWIKMIGKGQMIKVPQLVDARRAGRNDVVKALSLSNKSMQELLESCIKNGGKLPSKPPWLNFPDDVIHFLAYFIAHEGHHRGQIIMLARQLNHRFPAEVTDGVWQWTRRLKEAE